LHETFDQSELKTAGILTVRERILAHLLLIAKLDHALPVFDFFVEDKTLDDTLVLKFIVMVSCRSILIIFLVCC
jgi:hypothetical protein